MKNRVLQVESKVSRKARYHPFQMKAVICFAPFSLTCRLGDKLLQLREREGHWLFGAFQKFSWQAGALFLKDLFRGREALKS